MSNHRSETLERAPQPLSDEDWYEELIEGGVSPLIAQAQVRHRRDLLKEHPGKWVAYSRIRGGSLWCDAGEGAKHGEVSRVGCEERSDASAEVGRGEESRYRVHGSCAVFQHFTKQVVLRSLRAQHGADADGWNVEDAVRLRRGCPCHVWGGDAFDFVQKFSTLCVR